MIRNYLIFISFISLPLLSSVLGFRLNSARHQLIQYSPLKLTATTDVDSETKTKEKKKKTASASDLDEKYLSLDVVPEKEKKPKKRPKRELNKPPAGFIYTDEDGSYDVPFLDEPRWYRVLVRKSSEKRLCEELLEYREEDQWKDILFDAFVPLSSYVRMKGNIPELAFKPMTPGTIYVKTKMSPDIADSIEKIEGIYKFTKSHKSFVVPLSENEEQQIDSIRNRVLTIEPGVARLRREEYVSILSGPYAGRYGILMGAKNGKLQVCIRKEDSVDQWDYFDPNQLEYLANPPEKKWKTMTAKEAVESLLSKDPNHAMIWTLKKQGLLQEILHSEDPSSPSSTRTNKKTYNIRGAGVGESFGSSASVDTFIPGREKRIRSIAKEDDGSSRRRGESSSLSGGSNGGRIGIGRQQRDGDGGSLDEQSSDFESDLFKGDFDDIVSGGGGGASGSWSNIRRDSSSSMGDMPSSSGEIGNEFDSFIEDLLSQLDEGTSSSSSSSPPSTSSATPNKSSSTDPLVGYDFDLEKGHSDFKLQSPVNPPVTTKPKNTTTSTKSSNDIPRGASRDTSSPRTSRGSNKNQAVTPVTTSSSSSSFAYGELSDADRQDSERVLEELLADIGRNNNNNGITKSISNSDVDDNVNDFLKDIDEADFLDELYGSSNSNSDSISKSPAVPSITKLQVPSSQSSLLPPPPSTTTTTRPSYSDRPPENRPTKVYVPKSREVIIKPVNDFNDDDDLPDSIFDFGATSSTTPPPPPPLINKPEKTPYNNRPNRGNENKEPTTSSNNNNNNNNALKLEDFKSFEDYLDALVTHQKGSGGGGGVTGGGGGTDETDAYFQRKTSKPLTNIDKNKQQINLKNNIKNNINDNKVANNDISSNSYDIELDSLFSNINDDKTITSTNKLPQSSSSTPPPPLPVTSKDSTTTTTNSKTKKITNLTGTTTASTSVSTSIPDTIIPNEQSYPSKLNTIEKDDIFDDDEFSSLFNTLTSTQSSTSTSNNQKIDTLSSNDINWEDFINNLDLSETGNSGYNNINNNNNVDRDIFNEIFDIEDSFSETLKNKEKNGNKKIGNEFDDDDDDDSILSGFLETVDWLDDADTQKKSPTKGNSYTPNNAAASNTVNRPSYNTNNNNNRYENNNRNINNNNNNNNNGRDFSNNNNNNKPKKVWQPKSMSSTASTISTAATTSTTFTPAPAPLYSNSNDILQYKKEIPLSNNAEVITRESQLITNNIISKKEASSDLTAVSSDNSHSLTNTEPSKTSSKKQSNENYTVLELKDICKKNKLPVSGKKNELMERLEAAGLL